MKIVYTKEEVTTIIAKEAAAITSAKTTVDFKTYSDEEFATVTVETEETKASDEPNE